MSDRDDSRPFVETDHYLRKTFTLRFERRSDVVALTRVMEMIQEWTLETLQAGSSDDSGDPITREILPAGEDLRLIGAYLHEVARHRELSALTPAQRRMCDRAEHWAEKAEGLGTKILRVLEAEA